MRLVELIIKYLIVYEKCFMFVSDHLPKEIILPIVIINIMLLKQNQKMKYRISFYM